ncbi:DUF7946 domain-containing protein [Frigidibacter sp. MR17.24]|uniref:DUF7946 domain-containing protein n=1 Tax=Frigidibacter sp. MR17.24 TaxID=3127345 RepID=UPI003012C9D6
MSDGAVVSSFSIKYGGGEADEHRLPARHLAESLIGLNRIVSVTLFAIEKRQKTVKTPPEAAFYLAVEAPKAGSVELLMGVPHVAAAMAPFIADLTEAARAKLAGHIVGYLMLFWGGRKAEASVELDKLLDLLDKEARDKTKMFDAILADRQREREHFERILQMQAEVHRGDVRKLVAPVGRSCSVLKVVSDGASLIEIDAPTADAIREKEDVTVSGIVEMIFEVDGLTLSSKTMQLVDPENPGRRIKAHIGDPALDPLSQSDNPYEEALKTRAKIKLTGKSTRHADGRLKTFHAMHGEVVA